MTPGGYVRWFVSWVGHIIRTTARRSYATFFSILRLIRHYQVPGIGRDRAFQECGLALSSQPTGQDRLAALTLAVPLTAVDTTPPQFAVPGQPFDITLTPITPEEVHRYDRNVVIPNRYTAFEVKKGPLDCSDEFAPLAGWEPLTQPEGALVFYHTYKRVFTDANVRDPEIAIKIGMAVERAYEEARHADISLSPSIELALERKGDNYWGYYFADHDRRVIFWFEDYQSHGLLHSVRGVKRKSHVMYALESQYWKHIELFPNKRCLPEDVVVKLKEFVMHAHADKITSQKSIAPFTSNELTSMLDLMDPLMSSTDREHEHSVWIVARFMKLFYNAKFVNFCGQPGARLDSNQRLYEGAPSGRSRSVFLRIINITLFGSPEAYSKALYSMCGDDMPTWQQFMDKLSTRWNQYFGFFSTVMLSVNISFLALPSVKMNSDQTQTAATLVAYLSTLCAMGSLMVTIVLAGNGSRVDSDVMWMVLGMTTDIDFFAHVLSLPFALLIWAIIFFAAALSIVIFNTSDVVTLSVVSPIWAVIAILVIWPVLAQAGRGYRVRRTVYSELMATLAPTFMCIYIPTSRGVNTSSDV